MLHASIRSFTTSAIWKLHYNVIELDINVHFNNICLYLIFLAYVIHRTSWSSYSQFYATIVYAPIRNFLSGNGNVIFHHVCNEENCTMDLFYIISYCIFILKMLKSKSKIPTVNPISFHDLLVSNNLGLFS